MHSLSYFRLASGLQVTRCKFSDSGWDEESWGDCSRNDNRDTTEFNAHNGHAYSEPQFRVHADQEVEQKWHLPVGYYSLEQHYRFRITRSAMVSCFFFVQFLKK